MASSKLLPAPVNARGRRLLVAEVQRAAEDEPGSEHDREIGEQRQGDAGHIPRLTGDRVALQGEEHDDGEEQPPRG
jgi:hypothetical protein